MSGIIGWKSFSFLRWRLFSGKRPVMAVYVDCPDMPADLPSLKGHISRFRENGIVGLMIHSRHPGDSVWELVRYARARGVLTTIEIPHRAARSIPADIQDILDALVLTHWRGSREGLSFPRNRTYIKTRSKVSNPPEGVEVWRVDPGRHHGCDSCAEVCFSTAVALSQNGGVYLPCAAGMALRKGECVDPGEYFLSHDLGQALDIMGGTSLSDTPCGSCDLNLEAMRVV